MNKENYKISILWISAVVFFAYQFILRLTPGVLIDEIMIKYQISASTFGLIIAFYYVGYAGMQIPIGIMLNKLGVRYTVALSAIACVVGNVPLIVSDHWMSALIGRFIIGMGSVAGVLGSVQAARLNFSQKNLSKAIGLTVTLGLIGAIYGKSINRYLLNSYGMNETIIYLMIPGIIVATVILIFTKNCQDKAEATENYSLRSLLKKVLENPQIIFLSIAGALLVGPLSAFADVFGESFFTTVYDFTPASAGYLSASTIYIGMCIGSPLLAVIADRFKCHYSINIACGVLMAGAFYLILEKLIDGYMQMFIVTFITGIMCAYQVIVITMVSELVPPHLNGFAVSVVNMFNMLAGTFYNMLIGHLLDSYWTGEMSRGKRVYSAAAYSDALYILPIALMLGAIIFFAIKPRKGFC